MTQTTMTRSSLVNGIDVVALADNIEAIKGDAGLAAFRFRGRTQWLGGDRSRTSVKAFLGAGEEQRTDAQAFELRSAEPAVLLGTDADPNPVEHLLHALATCVTTTLAYHAAHRGIVIDAIESEIDGDIDLRGFLGLSDEIRKGCQRIGLALRVKSDAPAERIAELARFSPVFDTVSKSVPVELTVETA